ncbi:unnamed protein product, partial [Ectocarpus sp. 12 AP-2014]
GRPVGGGLLPPPLQPLVPGEHVPAHGDGRAGAVSGKARVRVLPQEHRGRARALHLVPRPGHGRTGAGGE